MPLGGFEQLESIIIVPFTLETLSSLAIGTGKGDGIRDSLVIREGGATSDPVISGSTIKGVVRSTIEGILAQAMPNKEICIPKVCLRRDEQPPDNRKADCGRSNPCPVCQLFGNTEMSGRANFHDAHVIGMSPETTERTHVALRRDTKTAAGGALMTIETVPPHVKFKGEVVLINPEPWMVGAIIHTLNLVPCFGIGAKKTSGYGEIVINVEDIQYKLKPEPKKNEDFVATWTEKAKLA